MLPYWTLCTQLHHTLFTHIVYPNIEENSNSSAQLHLTIFVSWNKLIETFWTCRDGFRIYEMTPETLSEAQEISLQSNTLKDMIFKNVTKNICWITMMSSANQSLNDLKPFLN
jgi:hypothetical protein